MKALQVIESAYRCNIEEQDDPTVWITHAMKGAGADLAVLLRGNAVNYAVSGQDASGVKFGNCTQAHPPDIERDITSLMGKGVAVYVVEQDLLERGVRDQLISGPEPISRGALPQLFSRFDQVWHW